MKRSYSEFPGDASAVARPVLDVVVEGMAIAPIRCLVDSGSVHTLMPRWVAGEAGVDVSDVSADPLRVGGSHTEARHVDVLLAVGDHAWEASVGFCEPWPYGWGLLGQQSFFRFFVVTFRAADWELEIEPIG